MSLPPGMIGVPCGELGRFSDFVASLACMQKPPGTVLKVQPGLGVANPLNIIGAEFMARPHLEWLFLTNDDNLCPPDTIPRLLSHGVRAVTGLYFSRLMPFEPVIFDSLEQVDGKPYFRRHLMQPGDDGLHKIAACGDGCLLIKREVLEKVPGPWWTYGLSVPDACDHDTNFCHKLMQAGIPLHVDYDVRVDHLAVFAVRPHREPDGEWQVKLVQSTDRMITLPAAYVGMEKANEEPSLEDSGLCCMAQHATAIPPWTCDCPCHQPGVA